LGNGKAGPKKSQKLVSIVGRENLPQSKQENKPEKLRDFGSQNEISSNTKTAGGRGGVHSEEKSRERGGLGVLNQSLMNFCLQKKTDWELPGYNENSDNKGGKPRAQKRLLGRGMQTQRGKTLMSREGVGGKNKS